MQPLRMPSLDATYQLALAAKAAGERDIFVTVTAERNQWALTYTAYGIRGLVLNRVFRPTSAGEVFAGSSVPGGTVAELTVRFPVIEILLAWKRDFLKRTNTSTAPELFSNRQRRRPRIHTKIR